MSRRSREPRHPAWAIKSTFVPRRDGPRRLEQAIRILLDADSGAGCIPTTTDEEIEHESRRLCQGLHREAGA
jgi:hypothetical protein